MYYKKPTPLELSASLILIPMLMSIIAIFILLLPFSKDDLTVFEMYEERYIKIIILSIKAIFFYFVHKELKKKKTWARIVTLITGIILLIGFPVGTIIGGILIYNMTKNWSKILAEKTNKNEKTNTDPQSDQYFSF